MVVVRDATEGDVNAIARVMKEFFTVHNVFSKSGDDVCSYLSSQMKERPLLVAEKDGEIKGAMFLVRKGGDGNHALWKYRHAVFSGHQVACALFTKSASALRARPRRLRTRSPRQNEASMNTRFRATCMRPRSMTITGWVNHAWSIPRRFLIRAIKMRLSRKRTIVPVVTGHSTRIAAASESLMKGPYYLFLHAC